MHEPATPICAVAAESTTAAVRAAIAAAAAHSDLVELRLDYLRDFDFANAAALRGLIESSTLPVIITCRAVDEGGNQKIPDDVRLRLLIEGSRRALYADVEESHYELAVELGADPAKLIVSYHDFSGTPADLNAIYYRLTRRDAAVHKIAVTANSIEDTLAVFRLLDRAAEERRKLIALSMGESGAVTRILGPSRGGFLTYGALAPLRGSAPGQFTCRELSQVYRLHKLSSRTGVLGVIGNPVSHSASPAMHNAAIARLGLDYVYLPFLVSDAVGFMDRFVRPATREVEWEIRGLSVTIPHKELISPSLDALDEVASAVGAVNTVTVTDGRLKGYNTDVAGALAPLKNHTDLAGQSVAVIGAGGSARALVYGLVLNGAKVTLYARNPDRARLLAERFGVKAAALEDLVGSPEPILINTTPVGMVGHSEGKMPAPEEALEGRQIVYDFVYNPLETALLAAARKCGCKTLSGIEMLACQAALQFELWTGQEAPRALMLEEAAARVGAESTQIDELSSL